MNILLLAYHISPFRGSECSVAWNHIIHMSKYHKITVIYGSSGDHLGDDDDMIKFIENNQIDNVTFHRIPPSLLVSILNFPNKNGILSYSFYIAYRLWHKHVYQYCLKTLDLNSFDLIHYLNPIGYREPGYLWKLNKPYVWGPIGGANNFNLRLLPALPFFAKCKYVFRNFINFLQLRYTLRLKYALSSTSCLLTATTENQTAFKLIHSTESIYLPENGTVGTYFGLPREDSPRQKIKLIWVGRLDAGKALTLLIDTLALLKQPSMFEIHIVGSGPLASLLKQKVKEKNLSEIFTWHGQLPRQDVLELMRRVDLNVISSVSEGNPTILWEAMQSGLPTISLDHCGMHDTISDDAGIKVKITDYDSLIKAFSFNLEKIIEDFSVINEFKTGVERDFYKYHWDNRVVFFNDLYEEVVRDFSKGCNINE